MVAVWGHPHPKECAQGVEPVTAIRPIPKWLEMTVTVWGAPMGVPLLYCSVTPQIIIYTVNMCVGVY